MTTDVSTIILFGACFVDVWQTSHSLHACQFKDVVCRKSCVSKHLSGLVFVSINTDFKYSHPCKWFVNMFTDLDSD